MEENAPLLLAWKFLEQTGTHIFLTGKAGTGKTTFLRNLRERSPKRMVVVAPTGVAAINAGGVTIHSFFQLPFGPYLPAMQQSEESKLRMNFTREKIAIIQSMDLLVIDEISMVRADLLDAINDVLQRYRDRTKPFGGVQLLMIGDLQQLAPVVKPQEWDLIRDHYPSPYFFDSKALRSAEYITLELTKIYRQHEGDFIEILNRVRNGSLDAETLSRLNARYRPGFEPDDALGYITLTSHNEAARQINEQKMSRIDAPEYVFRSETEGNFPEYLYPNDHELRLKKGAQVMFVKNDTTGQHRYFNGKIGRVSYVDEGRIEVTLDDVAEPIEVEVGEWTNAKYTIDPLTQAITEKVDGVFRQYPLKPAWAITIHKSQGLTFDRAIIDAADSFSHGQVYVALSRCRSFEGLVLRTPLTAHAIIHDSTVQEFNRNAAQNPPDEMLLSRQSRLYYRTLLLDLFDFSRLRMRARALQRLFNNHFLTLYPHLVESWNDLQKPFNDEVVAVSEKFKVQIDRLISTAADPYHDPQLIDRIGKAQTYFRTKCEEILEPVVRRSDLPADNKEVKKALVDLLKKMNEELTVKLAELAMTCSTGFSVHDYLETRAKAALSVQKTKSPKSGKSTSSATGKSSSKVEKQSIDDSEVGGDVENPKLFEQLCAWRKDTAEEENIPAYCIMHQRTLLSICKFAPRNTADLLRVKGIGKRLVAKYGDDLLTLIRDWADEVEE